MISEQKGLQEVNGKQREAALKESQERYSGILDLAGDGIISIDEKQRITLFNQSSEKIFGYQAHEVIGQPLDMLLPARFRSVHAQHIHDFATSNTDARKMGEREEIFGRRKDGTEFFAEASISRLRQRGRMTYTVIIRDITERKLTENQLRESKQRLEQAKNDAEAANRAKSIFLSNMSHELRTPLNAILGFAQIMARDENLSTKQQENLSIINRSGEHLLSLLNDILDLSKIEAGHATLQERDFDLYDTLNDLYDMFSLRAKSKSLQLIFEQAPEVPHYIRSDEKKLRQVLINLLNNAIKFTPSGQITLRVSGAFSPDRQAYRLHVEISDTGVGIAPEEIDQLFSAFVQSESGRKLQEGTGLGLAISQQFVRLMGGEISVSSQVGQGTTFKFEIPVQVVTSSQLDSRRPTRRVIGCEGEWRILVVDDKIENRALLRQLLSEVGFSVQEAINGEQAMAKWEAWQPHLIWMDMRMPVLDGYEATRRIKSRSKGEGTIIIALTASVLEEERNITLAAGCDDFVRKPFHKDEIFNKMQKYLGVRYIYQKLGEPIVEEPEELTSASLAILPTEWRAALQKAISTGDVLQIFELISQIKADHAPLATALSSLANDFDFDKLLDLTAES